MLIEVGGGFILLGALAIAWLLYVRQDRHTPSAIEVLAPTVPPFLGLAWAAFFYGAVRRVSESSGLTWPEVAFWGILLAPLPIAVILCVRRRDDKSWWTIAASGGLALALSGVVWFIGSMALHDDWL